MSRHRNLRNLDYAAELDDYDGDDYKEERGPGGMTKAQEEQMRKGLKEVRKVLGNNVPDLTDKEIQDHLWYYWFDVGQTINYILDTHGATLPPPPPTEKPSKIQKQKSKGEKKGSWTGQGSFGTDFEFSSNRRQTGAPHEFWEDAPWGKIPEQRKAILLPPILPKGGLLGGKMSKLAALAKARKAAAEKKDDKTSRPTETKASISLLSKLESNKAAQPKPAVTLASSFPNPPEQPSPSSPPPRVGSKFLSTISSPLPPAEFPISPPPSPEMQKPELKKPLATASSVSKESSTALGQDSSKAPKPASSVPVRTPPDQSIHQEGDTHRKPSCIDVFPTLRTLPSRFALSIFGERIARKGKVLFANERLVYFSGIQNGAAATASKAFAGPSPDDIVQTAQSRSKGAEKATGSTALPKRTQPTAEVIETVNTSAPTPQSTLTADIERIAKTRKNLDVLEEYKKSSAKENVNFVVIGHVDAGKSTIMGRILYDMGVVDERTYQKYKREAEKIGKASFALAWVLDETDEERRRGITMDIAMNKFETPKGQFTILDAPGHKDFVPNMIAGASQADFAVLVIDASSSGFEAGFDDRGQTKEHTQLVRSLGVQRIIVAVNKLDSVHWSQERFEEIQQQMSPFLTVKGFQPKNVSFVPCSGLTGDNVVKKPSAGVMPWYKGGTLIEELEKSKPLTKAIEKPFSLTISDVFRGGFTNPVSVSGRIESGNIQVGDVLLALPSNEQAAVKGIEVDERSSDWAVAGHNITLHLGGIDMVHLKAGDILCDSKNPIPVVGSFRIKILAFEAITPMMVDVYRGKLDMAGKIIRLIAIYDKSSGGELKKKPRRIPAGSLALIEVEILHGTIPVEVGTRIVLRSGGVTVAAGRVE